MLDVEDPEGEKTQLENYKAEQQQCCCFLKRKFSVFNIGGKKTRKLEYILVK